MIKRAALFLIFHFLSRVVSAQYATIGTGNLRNQIWWLDWAGFTMTEGASRTFTTNNGLSVTITFSKLSSRKPVPSVMNTWSGAILHLLYDFTDPAIEPALFDNLSTGTCGWTMGVTASRAGAPVTFSLITADAEASAYGEISTLTTNGGPWQTIDFFRNSSQTDNPLAGCGSKTVTISNTYAGAPQTGQNPVLLTYAGSAGPLLLDVLLDHGGTTGGMALAFGILESVDRGDLPASYGAAQHQLLYNINNSCNYLPPYPSVDQVTTLKIGDVAGDPDPIQYTDDNAIGVDEEGVAVFPVYDGSGSYSVNVKTGNVTGSDAFLTGWFDSNRNGVFDKGESVSAVIPNNTPSATLTWTGLPPYLPVGTVAGYGFRFRISSDQAASQNATGNARDGEVEDYFVNPAVLCAPMTVATRSDTTICAGQPVQLSATGGIQYSWSTGAGLSDPAIANPIATPATTTVYTVTGSTPQGCQASASLTIGVRPLPVITKSGASSVCPGYGVQLLGSSPSAASFSWSPSTGLNDASISNPYASPSATTEYIITIMGNNGCSNEDSIRVTVNPAPLLKLRSDTAICLSSPVELAPGNSPGNTYSWTPVTGLSDPGVADPIAYPAVTTSYLVTATNAFNCVAQSTVLITVLPLPSATVSDDTTVCKGSTVHLSAAGGASYAWSADNGGLNKTGANVDVVPTKPTRYYVLVTGGNGCSIKDSTLVTTGGGLNFAVKPPFTPVCKNDSVLLTASGGDIYSWSTSNGVALGQGSSLIAKPAETQEYLVQITDTLCQRTGRLSINVLVKDLPVVSLSKSNDIDCTLGQAVLQAGGGISYLWDSAAGISDLYSPDPVVRPLQTTVYHVKVTDSRGCSADDSIPVAVDFTADPSHYPIPSAFTPNHDGSNDCFGLKYWGRVTHLEMEVYNRWGQRVFFTNDPNECWDGTYKGNPQPGGGYVYQIRATTACGTVYRKGTVMLIR
ncbi:MAG TPA: CshA/CshB family fibrillar adhesin-related protein [Puia sp.]|nr:CshA/CshB family fibrillar adhesin-related protein [Puia sp.]